METKPRSHFESSKTYRTELLHTFDKVQSTHAIKVPATIDDLSDIKVGKVTFGPNDGQRFNHLAVDPTLLLMKTAVVASAQLGERLLPGCPVELDDWDEEDEQLALLHLANQRTASNPPIEIQTFETLHS